MTLPPTAHAHITALCSQEEVAFADLIGSHLPELHLIQARHRIWATLREEGYTLSRIAGWFGVGHSAVQQALAEG